MKESINMATGAESSLETKVQRNMAYSAATANLKRINMLEHEASDKVQSDPDMILMEELEKLQQEPWEKLQNEKDPKEIDNLIAGFSRKEKASITFLIFNKSQHWTELPSKLGELPNLDYLDFTDYTGKTLEGLPQSMPNLKTLDTGGYSGETLEGFPQDLPMLRSLYLEEYQGINLKSLPVNLPQLTLLLLTNYSGDTLEDLPQNMPKLEQLDLSSYSGTSLKGLPQNVLQLKVLDLYGFKGENLDGIPQDMPVLEKLNLGNYSSDTLAGLPENLSTLTHLNLRNYRGKSLDGFPQDLPLLEELDLNYYEGESLAGLPESMPSLVKLDLSAQFAKTLQGMPQDLPKLQSIDLDMYGMSGNPTNLKGLPNSLPALLEFELNNYKGENIQDLPQEMPLLQSFSLINYEGQSLKGLPIDMPLLEGIILPEYNGPSIDAWPQSIPLIQWLNISSYEGELSEVFIQSLKNSVELRRLGLASYTGNIDWLFDMECPHLEQLELHPNVIQENFAELIAWPSLPDALYREIIEITSSDPEGETRSVTERLKPYRDLSPKQLYNFMTNPTAAAELGSNNGTAFMALYDGSAYDGNLGRRNLFLRIQDNVRNRRKNRKENKGKSLGKRDYKKGCLMHHIHNEYKGSVYTFLTTVDPEFAHTDQFFALLGKYGRSMSFLSQVKSPLQQKKLFEVITKEAIDGKKNKEVLFTGGANVYEMLRSIAQTPSLDEAVNVLSNGESGMNKKQQKRFSKLIKALETSDLDERDMVKYEADLVEMYQEEGKNMVHRLVMTIYEQYETTTDPEKRAMLEVILAHHYHNATKQADVIGLGIEGVLDPNMEDRDYVLDFDTPLEIFGQNEIKKYKTKEDFTRLTTKDQARYLSTAIRGNWDYIRTYPKDTLTIQNLFYEELLTEETRPLAEVFLKNRSREIDAHETIQQLAKEIPVVDINTLSEELLFGDDGNLPIYVYFEPSKDGKKTFLSFLETHGLPFRTVKKWAKSKKENRENYTSKINTRSGDGYTVNLKEDKSALTLTKTLEGRTIELHVTNPHAEEKWSTYSDPFKAIKEEDGGTHVQEYRGHAGQYAKAVASYGNDKTALVNMGSCWGAKNTYNILEKSPKAHVIGTKSTGTWKVNDVLLPKLHSDLVTEGNINWTTFGKELFDRLSTDPDKDVRFHAKSYVLPIDMVPLQLKYSLNNRIATID